MAEIKFTLHNDGCVSIRGWIRTSNMLLWDKWKRKNGSWVWIGWYKDNDKAEFKSREELVNWFASKCPT